MVIKVNGSRMVLETITPERAMDLLNQHDANRPVKPHIIRNYRKSIEERRWAVNGEAIIIGISGRLLDGQHRLWACTEANKSFTTWVAYDVKDEDFGTIDQGKKRSGGDVLGIAGCKNSNNVASAIKWDIALKHGDGATNKVRLSNDEALQYWERNPEIGAAVAQVLSVGKIMPVGQAAAFYLIFADADMEAAGLFFWDLAKGSDLDSRDPVFLLREKLLQNKGAKASKLRPEEISAMIINAWNRRRQGGGMKVIRGRTTNRAGEARLPEIDLR